MTWHTTIQKEFLENKRPLLPKKPSGTEDYGIGILQRQVEGPYWRVAGVYHLAPSENRGGHYIFADVLDEKGNRMNLAEIAIYQGDNYRGKMVVDKGAGEPGTNTHMGSNETIRVQVDWGGIPSEQVYGLHTRHADEAGPGGERWNSLGHHSFYIVFQRWQGSTPLPTPDPPIPVPDESGKLNLLRATVRNRINESEVQLESAIFRRNYHAAIDIMSRIDTYQLVLDMIDALIE